MAEALAVAVEGLEAGELPIGAVVVADGQIVGRAHTQEVSQRRLLVHAELLALGQADRVMGARRLDAVLYTTLEPCLMCLGATASAMVPRVVYALASPGDGAAELAAHWAGARSADLPHVHLPHVTGAIRTPEARDLFSRFVQSRPDSDPLARWAATLLDPRE